MRVIVSDSGDTAITDANRRYQDGDALNAVDPFTAGCHDHWAIQWQFRGPNLFLLLRALAIRRRPSRGRT